MNKVFKLGLVLALVVGFGACKPKQSAYQSVYEAAKEREMQENAQTSTTVDKPAYPVAPSTNYDDEKVRQENITAVDRGDDANLRAYNVVVASLSVKPNAERLKTVLEQDGHRVILAQNAQGMYRVIVASYDDKPSAVDKKNEIARQYQSKGSTDHLRKTYGIPFDDLWILQRQF